MVDEKDRELGRDPGTAIKKDIVQCSGAGRQVALMPFIQACDQQCTEDCDVGPPKGPS